MDVKSGSVQKEKDYPLVSRKDAGQFFLILTASLVALTACSPANEQQNTPELGDEWEEFLNSGIPRDVEIEEIDTDPNLSPGAKQFLWAGVIAKEADKSILSTWTKTAIPQELIDAGLYANGDIAQVYKTKIANGGYCICDTARNLRIKVAADGSPSGVRLAEAYQYFKTSWTEIGVSPEFVDQIKLVRAGTVDSQPAVILVTPHMGSTFETFVKTYRASGVADADTVLVKMLEDYYRSVLVPMNASGVVQPDLNFKNIIVSKDLKGPRLVPIDLADKPRAFGEGLVFKWQYEELRKRSSSVARNLNLPTWEEYLAKNPDLAAAFSNYEYIVANKPFNLQIMLGGRQVKLMIPEDMISPEYANLSKEARATRIEQVISSVEQQLSADDLFLNTPQGGLLKIDVTMPDGNIMPVSITKATAYGEKIEAFGEKLSKLLETGKKLTKTTADVLMIAWIASEANKFVDPAYTVNLQSNIAFPDSVPALGRMEASYMLDNIFSSLMHIKDGWAQDAGGNLINWNPSWETMLGMTRLDAITIVSQYGVAPDKLTTELRMRALGAVLPVAECMDQFASPVPILIPGDELAMSAWFSAFVDTTTGKKMMVLWGQSTGDNDKIIPIAAFNRQYDEGNNQWAMDTILEDGWSIDVNLYGDQEYTMTCQPDSDGKKFILECTKK